MRFMGGGGSGGREADRGRGGRGGGGGERRGGVEERRAAGAAVADREVNKPLHDEGFPENLTSLGLFIYIFIYLSIFFLAYHDYNSPTVTTNKPSVDYWYARRNHLTKTHLLEILLHVCHIFSSK